MSSTWCGFLKSQMIQFCSCGDFHLFFFFLKPLVVIFSEIVSNWFDWLGLDNVLYFDNEP